MKIDLTDNDRTEKTGGNSPISPSSLFPLSAEAGNSNLNLNRGLLIISSTRSTTSFSLGRARNRTYYFRVAHFEVGGAIGGGLGADLRTDAAELVPTPPIQSEEGESVCGCVEWHFAILFAKSG